MLYLLIDTAIYGQSAPITIDGFFNDWTEQLTNDVSAPNNVSGVDLTGLSVTNNRDYLFVSIEADSEFDFSDDIIEHDIKIYLDTDGDTTNGNNSYSGLGADLVINLNNRRLTFYNPSATSVSLNDIGIRVAPTVTANRFEFAIPRNVLPDKTNRLFKNATIKILAVNNRNADRIPSTGNLVYSFDESQVEGYETVNIDKNDSSLIRVVVYNTLFNGLQVEGRIPHYERIMRALKPDIIGFSECWDVPATEVKLLMDQWLPLSNEMGWYVEKLDSRGLITASRWEILERWTNLPNQFPALIDLPDDYSTDLLFTNAHLNCCSNESGRQNQADAYTAFILDAKTDGGTIDLPQNTPFVYGGDLNLVGYSQQLTTLVFGDIQNTSSYGQGSMPDWDNSEVTDLISLHTEQPFSFTWKDEGSSFPPGKLDFILYSDAVIAVDKSFVLRTEAMNTLRLTTYNLRTDDTESASDHFPVVADFIVDKKTTGAMETTPNTLKLVPNPFDNVLNLKLSPGDYTITLTDYCGKLLFSLNTSTQDVNLSTDELEKGVYIITITSKNGWRKTNKVIKQ